MTETAKVDSAAGAEPAYTLVRKGDPAFVPGRRDFLTYRDLSVTAASGGRLRAQITSAEAGLARPTGWYRHVYEGQLVYMLRGWVDLVFADGTIRIKEEDSLYIPGGMPHNELATSESFDLIEVSLPAAGLARGRPHPSMPPVERQEARRRPPQATSSPPQHQHFLEDASKVRARMQEASTTDVSPARTASTGCLPLRLVFIRRPRRSISQYR